MFIKILQYERMRLASTKYCSKTPMNIVPFIKRPLQICYGHETVTKTS